MIRSPVSYRVFLWAEVLTREQIRLLEVPHGFEIEHLLILKKRDSYLFFCFYIFTRIIFYIVEESIYL